MAAPLAECVAVSRQFGDFTAVDRVDLSLAPGEVVGLLGANGAGKTTLIRMLLGLLPASAGQVLLFGGPPTRQTRRRLGYVPQGLGLYDDLTPAENLAFSAAVFGRGRQARRGGGDGGGDGARAAAAPEAVHRYGRVLVGDLPLGMQRRVAFAEALQHRPDLLILDEPTSGVDPLARARLWETIGDAAAAGAGVLVTTHYLDEAAECGRLVIMADGRVVAEGTAGEIAGGRRVSVVEAGSWAAALDALEAAGLPAALAGRTLRVPGARPAEVRRALGPLPARVSEEPATLEERFFELTALAGR
ncbi:MAG TPA: ABC transporter ATP-binding protein [Streptosporangiaceae bacterium]|nr:ABC transporter ATP-binding protein [Streptosporangiaceae bacterium]